MVNQDLLNLLQKNNITARVEWNTDKPTREGSQWFIGKEWEHGGKKHYRCWFGDYKTNLKEMWSSFEQSELTPEEAATANRICESAVQAEKEERERNHLEKAPEFEKEFENFSTSGDTPYLRRKQINDLFGCRIMPNENGDPILVVPMRDVDGKFWNYQRIYSQKMSAGDKFFNKEGRIDGTFHKLIRRKNLVETEKQGDITQTGIVNGAGGNEKNPGNIFLCEGFATAASVFMALGETEMVLTCFNAGNLFHVANEVRLKYPQAKITVCADNDAYTVIKNKPVNVGLDKGRRAAGAVRGECVWPIFKYPQKGLTDFNDLHCAEGLDIVKDQILNPENYVKGIQPMCLSTTKNGKLIVPSEKEVAEYLLSKLDGRVTYQGKALFRYNGTHWEELDESGINAIFQMINVAANGLLKYADQKNYFNFLKTVLPPVPPNVNMFQPNPFAANFQNGTLHAYRNGDKKYRLDFRPHDPKDYLLSTLPFDYPRDGVPYEAPRFEQMMKTLWSMNPDSDEIQKFCQEILGAALMPAFPIIAFFHGPPNAGKSTFIKLLTKIVGLKNCSNVQPCDFLGFNMETMIGKLVNFDTDCDINKPMSDSEMKKIIDRMPRRVRRKGRMDVDAYIPAVHLFAANLPPKSMEGKTQAYERRMALIHTYSFKAGTEDNTDFENELLNEELQGVIQYAVQGLKRLIENNGKYSLMESSRKAVREMEREADVVEQFLEDVRDGEVRDNSQLVTVDQGGKVLRADLWKVFDHWQSEAVRERDRLGKHKFFQRLTSEGFKMSRDKHGVFISGLKNSASIDGIG